MPKINLALLFGGKSNEREVSLKSGGEVLKALDKEKYNITTYDPQSDLSQFFEDCQKGRVDLALPILHGAFGEDGRIQGMLELLEIPYVFSDCRASALAMDKYKTKLIAQAAGLNISPSIIISINKKFETKDIIDNISFPIVIKPLNSGSSVGMSIVQNEEELTKGIKLAFEHDNLIMLEKYIKGRELTVAVIEKDKEKQALPVIEILPKNSNWFDYESKYTVGATEEVCPANIPEEIKNKVQRMAIDVFSAVGCKDLGRSDYIWSEDENKIYFLEINTIPGMTSTSLAPQASQAAGINFSDFLDILIENNLDK